MLYSINNSLLCIVIIIGFIFKKSILQNFTFILLLHIAYKKKSYNVNLALWETPLSNVHPLLRFYSQRMFRQYYWILPHIIQYLVSFGQHFGLIP